MFFQVNLLGRCVRRHASDLSWRPLAKPGNAEEMVAAEETCSDAEGPGPR